MIAVAIDGPSGAGKSTIARMIAKRLGYLYVDTGALYRAIALHMLQNGVDTAEEAAVCAELDKVELRLTHIEGEQRVLLCGRDVSGDIRRHEVSALASVVSALPCVRAFLLNLQRSMGESGNIVMDGRDIGTVVLPHAAVKIFLTADVQDRARRRHEELLEKGSAVPFETVLEDMKQRDYNDSTRAIAPLRQAADAVRVDTTGFPLERSVEAVLAAVRAIAEKKAGQAEQ